MALFVFFGAKLWRMDLWVLTNHHRRSNTHRFRHTDKSALCQCIIRGGEKVRCDGDSDKAAHGSLHFPEIWASNLSATLPGLGK